MRPETAPPPFNPADLIRPDIVAMEPYTPVVPFDVLSERLGRPPAEIVKLNANENPYGPSPQALAALAEGRFYHIYPDPGATALRRALSRFTGLPVDRLLTGAGADELIDLVLRAVLTPGAGVIDCPPTFGMYPFFTATNGGTLITVRRNPDFSLDIAGIVAASEANPQARVLFVCSPNNPDGGTISDQALETLLQLPLLVVLDEAYVDFQGESRLGWVTRVDNLVVLRTFSKLAGLAGLRVGYLGGPDWLLSQLWKIKQPYNVNVAAALAAEAALGDRAWLDDTVAAIVAERERLFAALAEVPFLQPYPSRANFILCRVEAGSAGVLQRFLEGHGILIRHYNKPDLSDCIRITAGRPADTDRLLAVLKEWEPT